MNEQAEKAYKSPRSKLVRFFEKSRDQSKAKCLEAKATAKGLKHRIRYLEQSKAEWKTKAKELEVTVQTPLPSETAGQPKISELRLSRAGFRGGSERLQLEQELARVRAQQHGAPPGQSHQVWLI
jgi:hypothetical protein